jgi:hypothetical protein
MKIRKLALAALLAALPLAGLFCAGGTSESGNARFTIVGAIKNPGGSVSSIPIKFVAEGYVPGRDTTGKVFSAHTDDQGEYRFENMTVGFYYLSAWVPGKSVLQGPFEIITKPEGELQIETVYLQPTAQVTMLLPDTARIDAVFIRGTDRAWPVTTTTLVLDSLPAGDVLIIGYNKNDTSLNSSNSMHVTVLLNPADTAKAEFNNAPPRIVKRPPDTSRAVAAGAAYRDTVVANDPEADAVRFSLLSAPSGMVIDSALGIVTWKPDSAVSFGNYRVGVLVKDARGSSRSIWWTVTVAGTNPPGPDTIAPEIMLRGGDTTIFVGGMFVDPGADVKDDRDGPLKLSTSGTVNTAMAGKYMIYYNAADAAGNRAETKTRTVYVTATGAPDTVAPVITLLGSPLMTLVFGVDSFVDPGYTALDNRDGNITYKVIVTGRINKIMIGVDTLYYNVTDAVGNAAATKTRIVRVVDTNIVVEPPMRPEIILLGKSRDTVPVGGTWVDPGWEVWAERDTTGFGAQVVVTGGPVVTTSETSFRLLYNFKDPAGNVADSKQRIVVVTSTNHESLFTKYGVPITAALATIAHTYRDTPFVADGPASAVPDLKGIKEFAFGWDLQNSLVNQFSLSLWNGTYMNFTVTGTQYKLTHTFGSTAPAFSISGSGISKLDGEYHINADAIKCVWVKTDKSFAIIFK